MTGLQLRVGDLAISFIVPLLGLPTSPFHHLQRWRTNLHFMFAPRKLDFDAHDDAMDASGELIPSQLTYDDDDEEDDFFHVNAPLMPLVSANTPRSSPHPTRLCLRTPSPLGSPRNSPRDYRVPPTPTPNKLKRLRSVQKPKAIRSTQRPSFLDEMDETNENSPREVKLMTNLNPFSPIRGQSEAVRIPAAKKTPIPRFVSDFQVLGELGHGSFGTVYKCINRTDGWVYAVKKILYKNKSTRQHMLKEAFVLVALGYHPNIVRYYSSWEHRVKRGHGESALFIQEEYCEVADIMRKGVKFCQNDLQQILLQTSSALAHMHSLNIAHGDIKPANIFSSSSVINIHTIYKCGDLGQINSDGDGKYLAPEMLNMDYDPQLTDENPQFFASDIFSLGMTIFEAARSTSTKFVYNSSMIQPVDIHLPPDQFDSSLVALLRQMMCRDPLRRPTAIDLIQLSSLHDSYSSNPTPVVSNAVLQLELSCAKARIAALEAALIDPMKVEAPPTKYPIV